MGQKVNPISLRLEKTNRRFDSCWYDDYNYTSLLLQDLQIKLYLKTVLNQINYPEGRVLIENLPKKGNIHYFYNNPSVSRKKKNTLFQLQNSNYNKKNTKKYKEQSFFHFPEQYPSNQTHLRDTLYGKFTIAQQTLEEWKNSVTLLLHSYKTKDTYEKVDTNKTLGENAPLKRYNQTKLLELRKPYESLKSIAQTKIPSIQTDTKNGYSKIKKIMALTSETVVPDQRPQIENAENGESSVVIFNKLCYRQDFVSFFSVENNINQILINFVINSKQNTKNIKQRNIINKLATKRFFIRYLLSTFYSRFLQNKSIDYRSTLQKFIQFYLFLFFKKNTNNVEQAKKERKGVLDIPYRAKEGNSSLPQIGGYGQNVRIRKGKESVFSNFSQKNVSKKGSKEMVNKVYCSNKIYKSHLQCFLSQQYNTFFNIRFLRTLTEKQGAFFLLQEIVYYLERKVPFRRIKTQILREIPHYKRIKGIRITCSGRVGGRSKKAQRSKTQSVKLGQTPLGAFSSKIDFASKSALTRFGLVGVKVWVCYQ